MLLIVFLIIFALVSFAILFVSIYFLRKELKFNITLNSEELRPKSQYTVDSEPENRLIMETEDSRERLLFGVGKTVSLDYREDIRSSIIIDCSGFLNSHIDSKDLN